MFTKREKVLIFFTAAAVSYVIMSNQDMANRLYDSICCKIKTMKEKLTPQ
jgi:cell division protein FtsL